MQATTARPRLRARRWKRESRAPRPRAESGSTRHGHAQHGRASPPCSYRSRSPKLFLAGPSPPEEGRTADARPIRVCGGRQDTRPATHGRQTCTGTAPALPLPADPHPPAGLTYGQHHCMPLFAALYRLDLHPTVLLPVVRLERKFETKHERPCHRPRSLPMDPPRHQLAAGAYDRSTDHPWQRSEARSMQRMETHVHCMQADDDDLARFRSQRKGAGRGGPRPYALYVARPAGRQACISIRESTHTPAPRRCRVLCMHRRSAAQAGVEMWNGRDEEATGTCAVPRRRHDVVGDTYAATDLQYERPLRPPRRRAYLHPPRPFPRPHPPAGKPAEAQPNPRRRRPLPSSSRHVPYTHGLPFRSASRRAYANGV